MPGWMNEGQKMLTLGTFYRHTTDVVQCAMGMGSERKQVTHAERKDMPYSSVDRLRLT